jgi:hypothetical protein
MDDYLNRVDVAPLESCLTSKESRAVRRGAVGKVPAQVTRRPPTLPHVRFLGGGEAAMLPRYPTDTVGEFALTANRPESGQDGFPRQAKSWVSGDPGEFATSVIVASGPISGSTQRSAFRRCQTGDDDHVDLHEVRHQG